MSPKTLSKVFTVFRMYFYTGHKLRIDSSMLKLISPYFVKSILFDKSYFLKSIGIRSIEPKFQHV